MRIAIVGCGWFGSELALKLKQHYQVSGTSRNVTKLAPLGINAYELSFPATPPDELLNHDSLVLNIPPFADQLTWFRSWPWNTKHLIFVSSTSVYGPAEGIVNEDSSLNPDSENARLLVQEENWVKENFDHYTILRFGGLFGKERHPGKTLSGRKDLKDGNHPVNLLQLEDAVEFTIFSIQNNLTGIFNVVTDSHPTREAFYVDYCRSKGIPLPVFSKSTRQGKLIDNTKARTFYQFRPLPD